MRKLLGWLIAIAALGTLYWWGFHDGRTEGAPPFALDMAQVRRLADTFPGPRPTGVRHEHVGTFRFFSGMVVAGDGWKTAPMSVYAFQVVYPARTVMIDAAFDRSTAPPDFITAMYDGAAYDRVKDALAKASLIVITHEHSDHIGGVLQHPQLPLLFPALRLTSAQLAHPERMRPIKIAPDTFKGYEPLRYLGMTAVAPGMVLIATPGHTPGSQMVFVKLADGREMLFLGDVVWHQRNIDVQRERPRWVTGLLIQEDREAVSGQIRALHALAQQEPNLKIVPGHDGPVIDALAAAGYLEKGFVSSAPTPAR